MSKYYTPSIEAWKPVVGYEGLYEVSNLGRIRKVRYLAQPVSPHGYKNISLCKDGVCKTHLVHRVVADAFIENPDNKAQVNHKDCDKTNNHIDNLEWVTFQENIDHAVENGRYTDYQNGEDNNMLKITEKDVLFIRELLADGVSAYSIHKDYYPYLHQQTIYGIKQGRLWKHLL